MISMKYKELSGNHFLQAFQKLVHAQLPVKVSYQVKKIADAIHKSRDQVKAEYHAEIIAKFAQKDEKGEPKLDADGSNFLPIDGQKEALDKAHAEFGEKTLEIARPKILACLIEKVAMTAAELAMLDPVLDFDFYEAPELVGDNVVGINSTVAPTTA